MAESQAKHAGGRPSGYSAQVAERICADLADGHPLRSAAVAQGISLQTAYNWLNNNPEFLEQYTRARNDQADTLADDMLTIADNPEIPSDDKRIRVDARKWIASKLKPKKYGDKTQLEHSGSIAPGPTDPEQVAQQFITMGTQYPTLNPLIRKMAEDILAKLPEIT